MGLTPDHIQRCDSCMGIKGAEMSALFADIAKAKMIFCRSSLLQAAKLFVVSRSNEF